MGMPLGGQDFVPAGMAVPQDTLLEQVTAATIGVASSLGLGTFDITGPSYLVALSVAVNGAATMPIIELQAGWIDPAASLQIDTEHWYVAGQSLALPPAVPWVTGRGPTRAAQLGLIATNSDPAQTAQISVAVYQSSRDIARADWRQLSLSAVPGYVTANPEPAALILGAVNSFTLVAGNSGGWLCGLYAGEATLTVSQSNAQPLHVSVFAQNPNYGAAAPYVGFTASSAPGIAMQLSLPRCPVTVQLNNTGAANTIVSWSLVAQENSS